MGHAYVVLKRHCSVERTQKKRTSDAIKQLQSTSRGGKQATKTRQSRERVGTSDAVKQLLSTTGTVMYKAGKISDHPKRGATD